MNSVLELLELVVTFRILKALILDDSIVSSIRVYVSKHILVFLAILSLWRTLHERCLIDYQMLKSGFKISRRAHEDYFYMC